MQCYFDDTFYTTGQPTSVLFKQRQVIFIQLVAHSVSDLLKFRFNPDTQVNTGDMSVCPSTYTEGSRIFDVPRYWPLLPFLSHWILRERRKEERVIND